MADTVFTGRIEEIKELNALLKKKSASIVAVKGRRRVGKSRLIEHFAKDKPFLKFTGLAPVDGMTAQDQRDEFARQLHQQTDLPQISTDNWSDLFALLAHEARSGRIIILFDEISWMAMGDPSFLPKLKNAWDNNFKQNNKLILVLCSSVSMWFEDNILSSTAFFGRISWELQVDPLPLVDCNALLEAQGFKSSALEKFKVLSVTGGIPWYIEQMQGQFSADENIRRQCFSPGGVMVDDFNKIFHDMFERHDYIYKKIILALAEGAIDYDEIAKRTEYSKSGQLSKYILNLEKAGFITKDTTWSLKTGKELSLCVYRLSDNYMRFYLHYIVPRVEHIKSKRLRELTLSSLPGWDSIMGLQFENLVISNRHELYKLVNIAPETIIYDNPFFQRQTTRQKGCQIDYLIQTKFNTLYLFEIKFSKNPVKFSVVEEMQEKIARISLPRNMAVLPVLVHVNGVSDKVETADYFHQIIAFGDLLDG
ncbi:MAG: ATPase [Legionellales bacterium]|nr:ATPase [Legionellales bacterium]